MLAELVGVCSSSSCLSASSSPSSCSSFQMQSQPPKLEDFLAGAAQDHENAAAATTTLAFYSLPSSSSSSFISLGFDDSYRRLLPSVSFAVPSQPQDHHAPIVFSSPQQLSSCAAAVAAAAPSPVEEQREKSSRSARSSPPSGGASGNKSSSPRSRASGGDSSRKRAAPSSKSKEPNARKSIDTFGQRTSIYRGVTRHRWTGRFEAHLWDNTSRREGQSRKGRQVYLGGYDEEEKAAKAYDLAALKYWGPTTTTNFAASNYEDQLRNMAQMSRTEFVAALRRKSSGFSRGASQFRGVTRHHQQGRWQARIGRVAGNKDLYLGTFGTQEEAAEAYDIAAIRFRGTTAVTNFDISRYDVSKITASPSLPMGDIAKKRSIDDDAAAPDLWTLHPEPQDQHVEVLHLNPPPTTQTQSQTPPSDHFAFDRIAATANEDEDLHDNFLRDRGSYPAGAAAAGTVAAAAASGLSSDLFLPAPSLHARSMPLFKAWIDDDLLRSPPGAFSFPRSRTSFPEVI